MFTSKSALTEPLLLLLLLFSSREYLHPSLTLYRESRDKYTEQGENNSYWFLGLDKVHWYREGQSLYMAVLKDVQPVNILHVLI